MNERIGHALIELGDAIIEYSKGAAAPSSVTAPAAAFAGAAPNAPAEAGNCPRHGIPWRTTKKDGSAARRAYCSERDAEGNFCDEKGPWLQSR